MPRFSAHSEAQLGTCHPDLQRLFREVIKHYDCIVLEGHRGKEDQERYVREGKSKVHWPNGNHNATPSNAADVAPYPVNWRDRERFYYFGGFVKGVAAELGIDIRWGGDWDSDDDLHDQTFFDLPHFELQAA